MTDFNELADTLGLWVSGDGKPLGLSPSSVVVTDDMVYAFLWREGNPVPYRSEEWEATRNCLEWALSMSGI